MAAGLICAICAIGGFPLVGGRHSAIRPHRPSYMGTATRYLCHLRHRRFFPCRITQIIPQSTSADPTTFAALMIPVLTTGVKREPGAIPGLFLKL